MYNLNCEPGHAELFDQCTHPLEEYAPGSERLQKLLAAMELAQKYQWPSMMTANL